MTRLIGAVQRVLKEDIGLTSISLQEADWDAVAQQVLDAIEDTFSRRQERFIGDSGSGQIASDLDVGLGKLSESPSDDDILSLMLQIPQGRRASFDKKTHRRIWVRTNRLTYIYLAAHLLENREPEEITEEVLKHLEDAQLAIRIEWGQSEHSRLAGIRPGDLDSDSQKGLNKVLGEEPFNVVQAVPFDQISEEYKAQIINELGRQSLTKIYRQLLLRVISDLWVEYLTQMEALRVSIGLEAYAQRDPLVQYKNRAFEMFQQLLNDMRMSVVTRMFTFQPRSLTATQATVSKTELPPPEIEEQPQKTQPAQKKRRRRRRKK
jgi:preprotein translocase subunit SecA